MSWLFPRRVTEATDQQRVSTGASRSGAQLNDNVAQSYGFRQIGHANIGGREVPERTREKARMDSIVAYRINPLGRAILDTQVAFCVGDAGLTLQCTSDEVRPFAEQVWNDPRNAMKTGRELMFRTWLIMGEQAQEMMVAPTSGVSRRSPIDTTRVRKVTSRGGNPLWPEKLHIDMGAGAEDLELDVIGIDDLSGLRTGEVMWWPGFKALETDTRGMPFLAPILDQLDSYDRVLSNLIDRTAIARYLVWDVAVKGGPDAVEKYIAGRGHQDAPASGSIEVHNEEVTWDAKTAQTGSYEDTNTNKAVMTSVAAGAGLSKVWLAEPEDANRATSLTMAEPVRRRIGSIQNEWTGNLTEMERYQVDCFVAANRLPDMVEIIGAGGVRLMVPTSSTVSVTGPQIAAADAQITAKVLMELAEGLDRMKAAGVLSDEARKIAAQKAWSDYVGVPWRAELDSPDANPDDVATAVDDAGTAQLHAV